MCVIEYTKHTFPETNATAFSCFFFGWEFVSFDSHRTCLSLVSRVLCVFGCDKTRVSMQTHTPCSLPLEFFFHPLVTLWQRNSSGFARGGGGCQWRHRQQAIERRRRSRFFVLEQIIKGKLGNHGHLECVVIDGIVRVYGVGLCLLLCRRCVCVAMVCVFFFETTILDLFMSERRESY